jgi:hypothetical protein
VFDVVLTPAERALLQALDALGVPRASATSTIWKQLDETNIVGAAVTSRADP